MSGYNAVLARNTEMAPKSIGPYSQTVAFSHYNNLSAQLPIDPKTGEIVTGGVKAQAVQCFKNIETILESIQHVMNDVVRISIFIKDIRDLDAVEQVYHTYFQTYVPARTIVVVNGLPLGALVQVEALVSNAEGTIPNAPQTANLIKLTNNTANAPVTMMSTQTVAFSHYNNLTTQLPIDPVTGRLAVGGIKEQTVQCLKNVKAILESIDVPLDDIVKVTIYLKNLEDLAYVDEIYTTFFPDSAIARAVAYMPARTVVAVSALPMDALVQMEVVVSHGDGTPPQAIEDRHGIVIKANNTAMAPINPLATQTVAFSHYNHFSAQLPLDPQTGKLVSGDVRVQTKQCLKNIQTILESIHHELADVVKVNLFLKDLADLPEVDEIYCEFFPTSTPARRTLGVSELLEDARIQIEVVVSNAEGTARNI